MPSRLRYFSVRCARVADPTSDLARFTAGTQTLQPWTCNSITKGVSLFTLGALFTQAGILHNNLGIALNMQKSSVACLDSNVLARLV